MTVYWSPTRWASVLSPTLRGECERVRLGWVSTTRRTRTQQCIRAPSCRAPATSTRRRGGRGCACRSRAASEKDRSGSAFSSRRAPSLDESGSERVNRTHPDALVVLCGDDDGRALVNLRARREREDEDLGQRVAQDDRLALRASPPRRRAKLWDAPRSTPSRRRGRAPWRSCWPWSSSSAVERRRKSSRGSGGEGSSGGEAGEGEKEKLGTKEQGMDLQLRGVGGRAGATAGEICVGEERVVERRGAAERVERVRRTTRACRGCLDEKVSLEKAVRRCRSPESSSSSPRERRCLAALHPLSWARRSSAPEHRCHQAVPSRGGPPLLLLLEPTPPRSSARTRSLTAGSSGERHSALSRTSRGKRRAPPAGQSESGEVDEAGKLDEHELQGRGGRGDEGSKLLRSAPRFSRGQDRLRGCLPVHGAERDGKDGHQGKAVVSNRRSRQACRLRGATFLVEQERAK